MKKTVLKGMAKASKAMAVKTCCFGRRNIMKKVFSILLVAAMLTSLTACINSEQKKEHYKPTGATLPISLEHSWACTNVLQGKSVMLGLDSRMFQFGDHVLTALYQPNDDPINQESIFDSAAVYSITEDTLTSLEYDGFPIGAVQEENGFAVLYQDVETPTEYSMVIYDSGFQEISTTEWTEHFVEIPEDTRELLAWHRSCDGSEFVIDSTRTLHYYDPEGEYIGAITDGIDRIIETSSGLYGAGLIGETMLCEIQPETRSAEILTIAEIPDFCTGYYGNQNEPYLYLDTGRQLWRVDVPANAAEIVIDYEASDLESSMTMAVPLTNEEMLLAQRYTDGYIMYRVHERTQEEIDNMHMISLATFTNNTTLNALIRRWNRQSDSVRIVVKSYLSFSGSIPTIEERETSEQDFAKFKAELLGGIVPDIICLDDVDYAMLSDKGMFEDLRPWMENDSEFRQEDYFMNLFESLSYQGAMERVALTFGVGTAVAKTEFLDGKNSISLEEYDQLAAALPEGMAMLPEHETRYSLLHSLALVQSDSFIDEKNASCRFDSEEFMKLLELCSTGDSGEVHMMDDYAWQENRALLYPASLYTFTEYHGIASIRFAEEAITLTGVPKVDATSSSGYFLPSGTFAVSSNSLYKEEIWEFIKFALQEEKQLAKESALYSFPVNREAFHLLFEAEAGRNEALQPQVIFMNEEEYLVGTPTAEEEQQLLQHVEELSAAYVYDLSLNAIVQEEAEMYFSGDCTAQEAAEKIQGRVGLYLAERR